MHNAYFIFCDIDGINMKIAQNKIKWFMALNVELIVHSLFRYRRKGCFVKRLQPSSEFIVEMIGNVACFLRKSFDLLGEIEDNEWSWVSYEEYYGGRGGCYPSRL